MKLKISHNHTLPQGSPTGQRAWLCIRTTVVCFTRRTPRIKVNVFRWRVSEPVAFLRASMKAEIGKQSLEWHVGTREQGEEGNAWHFFKALRIHFLHIKVFFGGGRGGEEWQTLQCQILEIRSEAFSTFFIFPETCPVSSVSGNHFLGETIQ